MLKAMDAYLVVIQPVVEVVIILVLVVVVVVVRVVVKLHAQEAVRVVVNPGICNIFS
jgi:hypothetical protein